MTLAEVEQRRRARNLAALRRVHAASARLPRTVGPQGHAAPNKHEAHPGESGRASTTTDL